MDLERIDFVCRILKISVAEKPVLIKLLEGKSVKETAEALNISTKTVEIHRTAIYTKIRGKYNLDIFI